MKYDLPANSMYGDSPIPITFPDNWDVHISKIKGFDTPALTAEDIREKIDSPFGAERIRSGAKGKSSAVIIIDDITRATPCREMAEAVIDELLEAGVPQKNIWFVAALGAHGPMYREHFVRKLGPELVERYECHNHNLFFNHTFLGCTSNMTPVEINADVMSADYKVAIGACTAHCYFGFGGGAKIILPGVSSLRTITANHRHTSVKDFNMGNPESLMRDDAEEAARMAGLDFKIDAVINGHGEVCQIFAGDFEREGAACREYAAEHYLAEFVPDCDVVVANNYLKPSEANVAYTPEVLSSLKDGGDFVLSSNSPLGNCIHYLYDKWGRTSPGGYMWGGCYDKQPNMRHAIVFAQYSVKGMRDPWYLDENTGAEYVKDWARVLRLIDDGIPKKVVVYPTAACQILTNSGLYYKK